MQFDNQDDLETFVRVRFAGHLERVESLTRVLSAEQRAQPRDDGGWSIDQILAHLGRMNETYIEQLDTVLSTDSTRARSTSRWKPTVGGRILHWAVTTTLPMKTPSIFRPSKLSVVGDPFVAFVDTHRKLLDFVERMTDRDWNATSIHSPASSLLKLNLGDVFLILAVHADRHLDQLERQREAVLSN